VRAVFTASCTHGHWLAGLPRLFQRAQPTKPLLRPKEEKNCCPIKSLTVPRRARSSACTYVSLCPGMNGKGMCNAFWSLDLLWASASVPRPAFLPKAGACPTPHTPSKTGTGETARPNGVLLRFALCASGHRGRLWRLAGLGTGKNCEGSAVERSLRPPTYGYEKKLATGGLS
jgi:hypothetical protein